jgi:phage terminase large subunit GpA-like protein
MSDAAPLLIDPAAESIERLRDILRSTRREVLRPIITPPPSEWAQKSIVLSPETSPGNWGPLKLSKFSRDLIDTLGLEDFEVAALMKSAQIGYTLDLAILMAWWLATSTTRTLFYAETEDKIATFAGSYLDPILHTTDETRALLPISEQKQFEKKSLTGATALILTAVNDENFRSYNGGNLIADEVDSKYWLQGGNEAGDKVDRLKGRGQSVDDGRLIMGSTPREDASSIIRKNFELGDQRRYHIPCPECGEMQVLVWGSRDYLHGLKWDDDPAHPYYRCVRGCTFDDRDKAVLIELGSWIPTAAPAAAGHISMHCSALYSPFRKSNWAALAQEFVRAKHVSKEEMDQSKLKVFINEKLGETWKAKHESRRGAQPNEIQQRSVIDYGAAVPPGVRVLTAFVDVQTGKENEGGHFELGVWGWGQGERGWLIEQRVLDRYPLEDPAAWFALEDFLRKSYTNAHGVRFALQAVCVDYGGTFGQQVSDFAARNADWRVWATKGRGRGADQRRQVWPKDPSKTRHGGTVYEVCTWRTKDIMHQRLSLVPPAPGSLSFPRDNHLAGSAPIDATYFARLTREAPRMVKGLIRWDQQPGDQEPWDCLLGSYAALHGLMSIPALGIRELVAAPKPPKKLGRPPVPGAAPAPVEAKPPAPVKRSKPKPTFGMASKSARWSRGGLLRGKL